VHATVTATVPPARNPAGLDGHAERAAGDVALTERGRGRLMGCHHGRGRGPKIRLVSAINQVDALMGWWLTDVRHQFGDDWSDPDAPLLPSERRDRDFGGCLRVGGNAVREGLAAAVAIWLPDWPGRLTPHGLRHFCASSLYARGVDLKAIEELLGHEWLSTTTRYINSRELQRTGENLQVAC